MLFGRSIILCREGWYYLLVLAFVVTGSFLREVNLLLVLAGMMLFPLLLNLRTVMVSTRGLAVRRRLPELVSAGDTFHVEVMLAKQTARGFLGSGASRAVVAEDQIRCFSGETARAQAPPLLFWRLAPGQQQRQSYRCQLGHRGLYQLGPIRLSSGFPLGLVRGVRRDKRTDRLVVLPRPGRLTQAWARLYQEVHFGSRASHHKHGLLEGDFHSLRDWRSGDSHRRIHWRTTARRGSPVVRQFEQQRDEDLVLLVDMWHPAQPAPRDHEIVENAVSFAATIVADICRRGSNRLFLGVSGADPGLNGGPASTGLMRELLENLAVATADAADRLAPLLALTYDTIPSGMTVIIVSPRALDVAQLERDAGLWDSAWRRHHSGRIFTICAANHELDDYFLPDASLQRTQARADHILRRILTQIMNPRLTLQIAFAVMTSLGTILLGMGSRNVILPVVAVFVAITSVYFTDTVGWIKLNRTVASVAALTAVALSLIDFYQLGRERQLLAIAYLLIYLQIVVMYQPKDDRIYWQLFMLSFLQVVVAAALNFSTTFGALLALYLFVALFVLSLFFLYREANRLPPHDQDIVVLDRFKDSPLRKRNRRQGWERAEALRAVWKPDSVPRRIGQRALGDGLVTIALTLVFFLLLPRTGNVPAVRSITGQRMVGFTDTVKLGDLGNAIENTSSVMRVWFRDPQNPNKSYWLHRPPLLRGTVVNHYENRSWTLRFLDNSGHQLTRLPMPELDDGRPVLQQISLEPQRDATVCVVYPAFEIGYDVPLAFDSSKQQIVRLGATNTKRDFTIVTTGLQHGLQLDITPVHGETERIATQDLLQLPPLEPDGTDPLANLKQVATEVIEQSHVSPTDRIGRARALENYLLDSGRFRYSLRTQRSNPLIDPVEDFIANNPNGHCEYFSSALTLMLRSQGIPARMVIGFKGGKWNSLGGYYQVRQLHAHSWVEVLLDEIPRHHAFAERIGGLKRAGWLRLDPTPGVEQEAFNAQLTLEDRIREWMNYSEYLWSNYVVDLNAKRQREGIYEPLAGSAEQIAMLFSKEFWTVTLPAALKAAAQEGTLPFLGAWLLGLVACVVLLLVLLTRRFVRRAAWWPAFSLRFSQPDGSSRPTVAGVEFYRQLEALLRRHGMQRPAAQTQREFAIAVGGQLAEKPAHATVCGIPKLLVDYFYRVRYGGARLKPQEDEQLQRSLGQLAAALKVR